MASRWAALIVLGASWAGVALIALVVYVLAGCVVAREGSVIRIERTVDAEMTLGGPQESASGPRSGRRQ